MNRVYRLWHEYCAASPGTMQAAKVFVELDEAVDALRLPPGVKWTAHTTNAKQRAKQKAWMKAHPDETKAVLKDMRRRGAVLTQGAA